MDRENRHQLLGVGNNARPYIRLSACVRDRLETEPEKSKELDGMEHGRYVRCEGGISQMHS